MTQDQILLYAADALDADESAAVAEHLRSGCPICAGRLAEAEVELALIAGSTAPVTADDALYLRIQARLATKTPAETATPLKISGAKQSTSLGRLLMVGFSSAAAAAAITFLIIWQSTAPTRRLLQSQNLSLVALAGSDQQPRARGRVLWDQQNHQWQVSVFDLAPPPPGRTFELWFITTDQQKIRATTFQTDSTGSAEFSVAVPANLAPLAMTAITDEPAGGVAQPTGSIQLLGKISG